MPVSAETIRVHLDYSAWATRRLVDAATQLTPEERSRDFATADRNVLGTLVHVYAADRAWLGRIEGNPPARFVDPETDLHWSVLQNDWPALHEQWRKWAAPLDDPSMERVVAYQDFSGISHQTPLWQIVLHVVNHATHHRGQTSGFLRTMGYKPPPLDLIHYYREKVT